MATNTEMILSDRILLRRNVNEFFIKNVELRYDVALEMMEINDENLEIIYCTSINKHTCMVTKDNKDYVIFDEHHMDTLGALNILYYLYGQSDFKRAFYDLLLNQYNCFARRLKSIVLILLSEQQLLKGNVKSSLNYIKKKENISLKIDDKEGALDLFILKMRKSDIAQSFGLNFYVFHEMAHIKYKQDPIAFKDIIYFYDDIYSISMPLFEIVNTENYKVSINSQECLCDIYALLKLFQYMDKNAPKDAMDDVIYYMIECYMISITNIVLMNSVYQNENDNLDEIYVNAYWRIILVINTLGILFQIAGNENILDRFQNIMNFVREQYENYKANFDKMWENMTQLYGKESEELEFMNEEWFSCYEAIIDIISACE